MNEQLTEQLHNNYPTIFVDKNAPPTKSLICFGFECNDGWYWLIDQLCYALKTYIESHPDVPTVVAIQVKEKYGGLRFYYYGGNEFTDRIVSFYETLSELVCEKCGSTDGVSQTQGGWISTSCEKCL